MTEQEIDKRISDVFTHIARIGYLWDMGQLTASQCAKATLKQRDTIKAMCEPYKSCSNCIFYEFDEEKLIWYCHHLRINVEFPGTFYCSDWNKSNA